MLLQSLLRTIQRLHFVFATVAKQTQPSLNPHKGQSLNEFLEVIPEEQRELQDLQHDLAGIIVPLLCLFIFVCLALLMQKGTTAANNAHHADLEAVRLRMIEQRPHTQTQSQYPERQERQQQQQQQQPTRRQATHPPKAAEECKERNIPNQLFSKTLEEGDSMQSIETIVNQAADDNLYIANNNPQSSSWARSSSWSRASAASPLVRTVRQSPPKCSICLDSYKTGDTICWAKTDRCDHIFHQECVVEWLKDHDDCPSCRKDIMNVRADDYFM
jgi:hypothetical protein